MCSRAVVIACRDAGVARARFGVVTGESGTIVTRTGRRFFADANIEKDLLQCLNRALDESGFWAEHKTDWVLFDCELMAVGEGAGVDPRPVRGSGRGQLGPRWLSRRRRCRRQRPGVWASMNWFLACKNA